MSAESVHSLSGFTQRGTQGNTEFSCYLSFICFRGSTDSIIILIGNGGRKTVDKL